MAKIEDNIVMKNMSGAIGKQLVFMVNHDIPVIWIYGLIFLKKTHRGC